MNTPQEQSRPCLHRVKEACRQLGIGESLFYQLVRQGKLRTVRVGTRGVRVPSSEIERFVAEQLGREGRI